MSSPSRPLTNHGSQYLLVKMDQSRMRPTGVSGTPIEAPNTLSLAKATRYMEDGCSSAEILAEVCAWNMSKGSCRRFREL
jgi:hypothetical protein